MQTALSKSRAALAGGSTLKGGTKGAQAVGNKWQALGAETKRILFRDPAHVAELDQFFKLYRVMDRNINPSGTAHAMQAGKAFEAAGAVLGMTGTIDPLTAITTLIAPGAASAFLHSRAGVRLLTKGVRIPLGNKAAWTAWAAQLSAMAEQLDIGRLVPATANDADDEPSTFVRAR